MEQTAKNAFLLLVLVQAAHSIEEYVFRLYDVFPPARFVSGLVSDNLRVGFVLLNTGFVVFGLWCYLARVRPARSTAPAWMWGWVFVEIANGVSHLAIAASQRAYMPGVMTAPLLLVVAVYLGTQLRKQSRA